MSRITKHTDDIDIIMQARNDWINSLEVCENREKELLKQFAILGQTTRQAIESYNNKHRTKRIEPLTIAIAASILTSGYAAYHSWSNSQKLKETENKLRNTYEELGNRIDLVQNIAKNISMTLVKLNENNREITKQKFNLLETSLSNKYDEIDINMKINMNILSNRDHAIMTTQLIADYQMLVLSKKLHQSSLILDLISTHHNILLELQQQKLSRSLVTKDKLQEHLTIISSNLPNDLELAISVNNWKMYYELPLVNFEMDTDRSELWVNLAIPLKRIGDKTIFQIIKPNFLPFPIASVESIVSIRKNGDTVLIKNNKMNLVYESSIDNFNCINNGAFKLCYTYNKYLMRKPSKCSMVIDNWNLDQLTKYCNITYHALDEYQPILVNPVGVMIHKQFVPQFVKKCHGMPDIFEIVDEYAIFVPLDIRCQLILPALKMTINGQAPFNLDESIHKLKFTSFHSGLINELSNQMNYITPNNYNFSKTFNVLYGGAKNSKFLTEWNKINFENLDKNLSKDITEFWKQYDSQKQELIKKHYWSDNNSSMISGWISLLTKLLYSSTIVILIFVAMKCEILTKLLIPIIVKPTYVNAAQNFHYLPNFIVFDVHVISIIICVIVVILFTLLLWRGWFRTKQLRHFECILKSDKKRQKFSILVELYFEASNCREKNISTVSLTIPVEQRNYEQIFSRCHILNHLVTYYVCKEDGLTGIRFLRNIIVDLEVVDAQGLVTQRDQFNSLNFYSFSSFTCNFNLSKLMRYGSHGFAIVHVFEK